MLQRSRHRRSLKKIITFYGLFSVSLVAVFFLLYIFNFSRPPLIVSPLGKSNIDTANVEKLLKEKNILSSSVVVLSDSSYLVTLMNNEQVRLSPGKNINHQISSLQRILRELTIEGKPFKGIDFRFEEPIVSF